MSSQLETIPEGKMGTALFAHSNVLSWSPDGKRIAVVGQQNNTVDIYVLAGPSLLQKWLTYYEHRAGIYRRCGTVTVAAWSSDGNRIASASSDGSIHVWNAQTGMHQQTLAEACDDPVHVLFWTDAKTVVALCGTQTQTWKLSCQPLSRSMNAGGHQ